MNNKVTKDIEITKLAFETGMLEEYEIIKLIQSLINDGAVWQMDDYYIRHADALIRTGQCRRA